MTRSLPPIEGVAEQILERAEIRQPPVPLDAVVQLWPGLRVTPTDLDGDAFLLDLGRLGGEIVVREDRPPTRRRFSIAHELAHWVLLRETQGYVPPEDWRTHVEHERWCDRFAAALLMPESWVRREVPADVSPEGIAGLASIFGVSPGAARLRLTEATPISLAEVSATPAGVRVDRFEPSRHAKAPSRVAILQAVTAWPDIAASGGFTVTARLVHQVGQVRRWLVVASPSESAGLAAWGEDSRLRRQAERRSNRPNPARPPHHRTAPTSTELFSGMPVPDTRSV